MSAIDPNKIIVKELTIDDWQDLKDIRLYALQESPNAFGGSYDEAIEFDDDKWRSYFAYKEGKSVLYGLYDGCKIVGLGNARISNNTPLKSHFYMGYIHPLYRGLGLSRKLYQARIEWSENNKATEIEVNNRESNKAATAMNQSFGFQQVDCFMQDWPDGTKERKLTFKKKLY